MTLYLVHSLFAYGLRDILLNKESNKIYDYWPLSAPWQRTCLLLISKDLASIKEVFNMLHSLSNDYMNC